MGLGYAVSAQRSAESRYARPMSAGLYREFIADEELDYEEVERLLPEGDHYLRLILLRRPRERAWAPILVGQPVHPGDALRLVAVDGREPAAFDAWNAEFSSGYYPTLAPEAWPDERALIDELVPRAGATVLEICCGGGRVTPHLVRDGNRVIGLDRSAACVASAHARDGSSPFYLEGDAAALPFADGAFDVAACFENSLGVIFSSRLRALAELLRVTRPGGLVLVVFREDPASRPDRLHAYYTDAGAVEVAETFDRASVEQLLAALPDEALARISARSFRHGSPRPWGGVSFALALDLGPKKGTERASGTG